MNDATNRTQRGGTQRGATIKKKKKRTINIDFELRSPKVRLIFVGVLALLVLVFFIYQFAVYRSSKRAKLPTQTALMRTISRNIEAEGVVIREESVLQAHVSGTVVPRVENGSKVSAGDTVAEIYTSATDAQYLLELDELQRQISYYEEIRNLNAESIYENKETYNNNISQALIQAIACIDENDLGALSERLNALSITVTKKQNAVNKQSVDVTDRLNALYLRREELQDYISIGTALPADRAGYYVDKADGYENAFDFAAVEAITPEGVKQLLNAEPEKEAYGVGKLITQFNWYLVCSVGSEAAAELKVGAKVPVSFSGYSGGAIRMQLTAVNEGADGRTALVFKCNLMNSEIASLRVESIKICLEEYSGYAVDYTALRTVDGVTGVYVQVGNLVRFRKVNVVYTDDNIILAEAAAGEGYLRLYDEIITEGLDLYDGKIID